MNHNREQVKLYTGTLVLESIRATGHQFRRLGSYFAFLAELHLCFAICRILLDFSCSCDISLYSRNAFPSTDEHVTYIDLLFIKLELEIVEQHMFSAGNDH